MKSPLWKSLNDLSAFLEILLSFDSPIEDGTVSTLTEDVQVKRSLASLTLDPQVIVVFLIDDML